MRDLIRRRLWNVWRDMCRRCDDPSGKDYRWYGRRGITVCADWRIFANFYKWMIESGYKFGLTVDRIDNNKGYSPENCRLADKKAQAQNRTDTKRYYSKSLNRSLSITEWADFHGVTRKRIIVRVRNWIDPALPFINLQQMELGFKWTSC